MRPVSALAGGLLAGAAAFLWSQAGAQSAGSAPSVIRKAAEPIPGTERDYTQLLGQAATKRRVLLGESTHGTHDYYRERARISERLIRDHGMRVVAIEGDWTPTWRVNLYVRGLGRTGPPRRRCADIAISRTGCGAMRTFATSSSGCAPST